MNIYDLKLLINEYQTTFDNDDLFFKDFKKYLKLTFNLDVVEDQELWYVYIEPLLRLQIKNDLLKSYLLEFFIDNKTWRELLIKNKELLNKFNQFFDTKSLLNKIKRGL